MKPERRLVDTDVLVDYLRGHGLAAKFLEAFTVVPVDRDIAAAGGLLRGRFGPSHGTGLADALIAATANQHDATLVTLNRKPYPMVSKCELPYAKAR